MLKRLKIILVLTFCGVTLGWASLLFHVTESPWCFDMISDLHAGSVLFSNSWERTVTVMTSSNKVWNEKLLVSPGDLFEQDNVAYPIGGGTIFEAPGVIMTVTLTNDLHTIQGAGIDVAGGPGNHDSDDDVLYNGAENKWDSLLGTNFLANNPNHYYFTNFEGSTKTAAWNVTNGTSKFLFICLKWNDNTNQASTIFPNEQMAINQNEAQVMWARSIALSEPDHSVIVFCHWFANSSNTNVDSVPPLVENQNGLGLCLWSAFRGLPNWVAVLCGHIKAAPMLQHDQLIADDGHTVQVIRFNTQSMGLTPDFNGDVFVRFQVFPSEHMIHAQLYNSRLGRFMTNNDAGGVADNYGLNTNNDWTFGYRSL